MFSYIKFSARRGIGNLETLRGFNALTEELRIRSQESGENPDSAESVGRLQERLDFLSSVGYLGTDDLDEVLIDFVEHGILDEVGLASAVQQALSGVSKAAKDEALRSAWNMFNQSFRDNQDDFVQTLTRLASDYNELLGLSDIDNILWALRRLGFPDKADEVLDGYVHHHGERVAAAHEAYAARDEGLRNAIDELRSESRDERPLAEVLTAVIGQETWFGSDVERIHEFSVDDFERYFEEADGPPVGSHARGLARFASKYSNPTDLQREIQEKATLALKRIAAKSDYNRARIERYVDLESD